MIKTYINVILIYIFIFIVWLVNYSLIFYWTKLLKIFLVSRFRMDIKNEMFHSVMNVSADSFNAMEPGDYIAAFSGFLMFSVIGIGLVKVMQGDISMGIVIICTLIFRTSRLNFRRLKIISLFLSYILTEYQKTMEAFRRISFQNSENFFIISKSVQPVNSTILIRT